MLSAALVVFREVFEIVLIVGIVLAATRAIPNRNKAVYLGFGGGLIGSLLVAAFTGTISGWAEGLGQEYFNAGILFAAAGFIGWTLVWMKRHARHMKAHFQKIGQAVADGTVPFITLSLVIALAILREGSEIALFSYGMLATGLSPMALGAGALLGMIGGAAIGILLYVGLIKLSTKVFFQVTSWMLVLVVAGMVSQAIGFLTAAGAFESLSFTLWDSSWLVRENGLLGQSLGALIGYTAQPTAIQFMAYMATIGLLFGLIGFSMPKMNKTTAMPAGMAILVLGVLGYASPAHATKKVYTPYVEAGELELESKTGYDIDDDSDVDGAWKEKLGVGYGVNEHWFTEAYVEFEHEGESDAETTMEAIEWENKFMLTNPGEYWADVGALVEYVYNTSGGVDKIEGKLLLAKATSNFDHAANIILERQIGEDASNDTEAGFAWNTQYRYSPQFEPGFELYSEFGSLSDGASYDEQKHQIGPVVKGKLGDVKYDVGVLFGASDAAPDASLKAILEYEFKF